MSDVEYTELRFYVAMDNYEPFPRREEIGVLYAFTHPVTGKKGVEVRGGDLKLFPEKCILLIDDGKSVIPHYISGYVESRQAQLFYPFPTNPNNAVRPDNGRPIDFDTWKHGPTKAYHLKVTPA